MKTPENIRETHRPDWLPVILGCTSTLASLGVLSLVGNAVGAFEIRHNDHILLIVVKILYGIVALSGSLFLGSFVVGALLDGRNRVAAAMDGLLVWIFTIVVFGALGWFGYPPLPGVFFTPDFAGESPAGVLWMAMMLGLPLPFAAAYGAMAGNDHVGRPRYRIRPLPEKLPPSKDRAA